MIASAQPGNAAHEYLRCFFTAWNRGDRKHICPRWLKAPGGLYFSWGVRPDFRGQEPVTQVLAAYREEFFDGEQIRVLEERTIRRIDIDVMTGSPGSGHDGRCRSAAGPARRAGAFFGMKPSSGPT